MAYWAPGPEGQFLDRTCIQGVGVCASFDESRGRVGIRFLCLGETCERCAIVVPKVAEEETVAGLQDLGFG